MRQDVRIDVEHKVFVAVIFPDSDIPDRMPWNFIVDDTNIANARRAEYEDRSAYGNHAPDQHDQHKAENHNASDSVKLITAAGTGGRRSEKGNQRK